jgi:hypothetical protein
MTGARCATAAHGAAERRGEDTHWWTAYRLHSSVAPSDGKPYRPTETPIHRAASEALGALQGDRRPPASR